MCVKLINSPGKTWNPLIIHGAKGGDFLEAQYTSVVSDRMEKQQRS